MATTNYAAILFGLVTGPITARALGPAGKGEVAAAAVYSANLAIVLGFGVPNAIAHALATRRSTEPRLLATAIRYAAILIVPSLLIGVLAAMALKSFTLPGRIGVFLMIAGTPLSVALLGTDGMIRATGDLVFIARVRVLSMAAPAIGVVVLACAGQLTVLTMAIVSLVGAVIGFGYRLSGLGTRPERGDSLGPLLRYGARSALNDTSMAMSARLDQILMAPILGAAALGVYAVAVSMAAFPLGLSGAIATRAFARIGAASEPDRLPVACRYLRLTLLVTVPVALVLAALAPYLIPLVYGERFSGAVAPMLLSLPATVAMAFFAVASAGLMVLGYPGRTAIAQAIGTAIGLASLLLLLGPLGIEGAAIATSIDFGVSALLIAAFLRRLGACAIVPRRADARMALHSGRRRLARLCAGRKSGATRV